MISVKARMTRRIATIIACLALLAAAAGGCGGGSDGSGASDAANSYVDAYNSKNAEQLCSLFSDHLRQQLGGDNCARFLGEQISGVSNTLKVTKVDENGDHATADLESSGEKGQASPLAIVLEKQNGDWKVSAIGRRVGTTG
jgi:ketosteroid isomerase-like protein